MENNNYQELITKMTELHQYFRQKDDEAVNIKHGEIRDMVFQFSLQFPEQHIPQSEEYYELLFIRGAAACYNGMAAMRIEHLNRAQTMHIFSIQYLSKIPISFHHQQLFLILTSYLQLAMISCFYESFTKCQEYLASFDSLADQATPEEKAHSTFSLMQAKRSEMLATIQAQLTNE